MGNILGFLPSFFVMCYLMREITFLEKKIKNYVIISLKKLTKFDNRLDDFRMKFKLGMYFPLSKILSWFSLEIQILTWTIVVYWLLWHSSSLKNWNGNIYLKIIFKNNVPLLRFITLYCCETKKQVTW